MVILLGSFCRVYHWAKFYQRLEKCQKIMNTIFFFLLKVSDIFWVMKTIKIKIGTGLMRLGLLRFSTKIKDLFRRPLTRFLIQWNPPIVPNTSILNLFHIKILKLFLYSVRAWIKVFFKGSFSSLRKDSHKILSHNHYYNCRLVSMSVVYRTLWSINYGLNENRYRPTIFFDF